MTESEIQTRINEVNTAIHKIMFLGVEYEIDTGGSKRRFRSADLPDLREYLYSLENQLKAVQGNSGLLAGY